MAEAKLQVRVCTLGPFATNCYIVWPRGSKSCWIIDASFDPQPIVELVKSEGLIPDALLLTHAHVDHIAGVEEIRDAFPKIPVMIHEDEADWLVDAELNMSAMFGLPVACRPPERQLLDGDELTLDGVTFQVLHTPGHSPGGVGFYSPQAAVLLAGDTLFAGSIGRTDFPNADHATLLRSIEQKLMNLPKDTRVYPGHGPETTIARECASNPFLQ